jgi:hypothetical protein
VSFRLAWNIEQDLVSKKLKELFFGIARVSAIITDLFPSSF